MQDCDLPITNDKLIPIDTLPSRYNILSLIGCGKHKCVYHVYDNILNRELALYISYYIEGFSLTEIKSAQTLKSHNMSKITFNYPIEYAIAKTMPKEISDQVILYDEEDHTGLFFIFTTELLERLSQKIISEYDDMCFEAIFNYKIAGSTFGWIHGDWDIANIMMKKIDHPRTYGEKIIRTKYAIVFIDYSCYAECWEQTHGSIDSFDEHSLLEALADFPDEI